MVKPKMKSGSEILTLLRRVHKEYNICKNDKKKGIAHPDTVLLLGMVTFGTWLTSDTIDKELMQRLDDLHDIGPIEKNLLNYKDKKNKYKNG